MKARKVVTRSSRKFKGLFPSRKLKRMVEWESLPERDAILLFEFSNGIKSYQEQPDKVMYEHDGEMRRYYPDFSTVLSNGEIIYFEVKPNSQLALLIVANKLSAVKHHYDRIEKDFRILAADKIRTEPRLSNLKRLASVQHRQHDYADIRVQVTQLLTNTSTVTVSSLFKTYGITNVLLLIAHGHICCDLNMDLIFEQNFLRLPEEHDHDSLYV